MKAPKKTKQPKAAKAATPPKAKTKDGVPGTKPAQTEASVVELPTKTKVEAKAATPGAGTNQMTEEQKRALALRHAEKLKDHKASVATANGKLRAFLKEAKSDGFSKALLEAVLLAQTPEGEAVLKDRVRTQLQGAKWAGQPFGDLLGHLESPDLTPAVDRARDEGRMASMQNKPARPDYHASTPQYAAYMEGYHQHQESLLKDGIKPIESDDDKDLRPRSVLNDKASQAQAEEDDDGDDDDSIDHEADEAAADASNDPDSDISGAKVFRSEYERMKKTESGDKPVDDFA